MTSFTQQFYQDCLVKFAPMGRVPGRAHIAPAEERAERTLEQEIEKALRG